MQRISIIELKNETSSQFPSNKAENTDNRQNIHTPSTEEEEEVKPDTIKLLRQRIEQIMQEERPYLKPDLKISDIAMRLATNRDYIYQAINVQMGISFADYVNSLRIGNACRLLQENPSMILSDVMVAYGYSSSSTFYRSFRKYTGKTQAVYILAQKATP
jgi:YesN/AraC family two-component response regulator